MLSERVKPTARLATPFRPAEVLSAHREHAQGFGVSCNGLIYNLLCFVVKPTAAKKWEGGLGSFLQAVDNQDVV